MKPALNLPLKKKFLENFYVHKENNDQYKIDCDKIDKYNNRFGKSTKILWYASAGYDFKPVNFLSQLNINRLQQEGKEFETPKLFVYSCLGPELKKFVENYGISGNNFQIHDDDDSLIEAIEFIPLEIIRGEIYCDYEIDHNYIDPIFGIDPLKNHELNIDYDAFFMKGQITHKKEGKREDFFILYLFQENSNFFREFIIKKNFFEILWLCTDREGCGLGGCKKSMITHIYVDGAPSCYQDNNFKPKYIIPFSDFTLDQLRNANELGYINLDRIPFQNPVIYRLVYKIRYNTQIN